MKTIEELKTARTAAETQISKILAEFATEYELSDIEIRVRVTRHMEADNVKNINITT